MILSLIVVVILLSYASCTIDHTLVASHECTHMGGGGSLGFS
jgi:hypothetical protein